MRKGLGHASPVEIAGEDCSNLDIGSQSHTRHTKPTEPDQREPAQAHIVSATQEKLPLHASDATYADS